MGEDKKGMHMGKAMFLRMLAALAVYTAFGAALYLLAMSFFRGRIWQGDEWIYRAASWAYLRIEWFVMGYLTAGYLAILYHFWKKPFSYLDAVAEAAETMYRQDDSMVSLPPQLSQTESRLNRAKLQFLRSERAAREAEQRKNDLVTYLAHDLKTPITSIIGYLTLLEDEPQISQETRGRYLSIAREKAERLDDLINEFFEITRFNLSHITLEKTWVSLERMLQQLVFEFEPMLREKALRCELTCPEPVRLECDPDKLGRVLDNLLKNAVSYSYEGSVIRIGLFREGDKVKIVFENRGDTIPEEKLRRIFDQFFRLDSSRSSRSGGAGLGLSIARQIVQLHGGTVTAFSQNHVIRFEVTLPADTGM